MKAAVGFSTIIFLWICFSSGVASAEKAGMIGMENSRGQNVNRVSFVFDQIPEVEISTSGQRVRVVFINTEISESFEDLPDNDLYSPLRRIKTDMKGSDSIVDLYFRDVPEFVDTSTGDQYGRISVNVFWDHGGGRPAIHDQKFGRLRPIMEGVFAERVIDSDYKGRWEDFFQDFEWPPELDMPIEFSFPGIPGPLVEENQDFFPQEVSEAAESGLWGEAEKILKNLIRDETGDAEKSDYLNLLLAEMLLRQEQEEKALEKLKNVDSGTEGAGPEAWKAYYKAYALAESEKYFQAARILEKNREKSAGNQGLAPWYALFEAELELSSGSIEQAIARLESDEARSEKTRDASALRRADGHFKKGRHDQAFELYSEAASDLALMQSYPASLANWSMLLYRRQEFDKAHRYCYLLSETLAGRQPELRRLADYWAAMASLRSGNLDRARLALWEIDEKAAGTEAGFRAWLELIDLDVMESHEPDYENLVHEYDLIIEESDSRQVREEAFFKKILAYHLSGDDFSAVKFLGRFFDDYWGGQLQDEGRALFVEIFPGVIDGLVEQEAFFEALALVSKHRDLLAQAGITYDFLHDLAESYTEAGFLEQAAETYLYILDFEKQEEKRQEVFVPLVEVYHELENFQRVERYAADYLDDYPEGSHRAEMLYFYAHALIEKGELDKASGLLHENKRPRTARLDYLAGRLFFDKEQWERAWRCFSRAAKAGYKDKKDEITFKRAEAGFYMMKWEDAEPAYRRLLEADQYKGQAGFRLVQLYSDTGRESAALNLYNELAEMEIEEHWLELAGETVEIENRIKGQ
ncbi:MAG: bacterial transcriptional activator domain-containing protein [Desulfosalsimonas sp.]